jgi:protease I
MASGELNGQRVAILVADGFEQIEMPEPRKALEQAGAKTDLGSPAEGKVRAFKHDDPGDKFPVDVPLQKANADDYDALMLPGGVANPDKLRWTPAAVQFVQEFARAGKPIAAICHAPWTLIDAGLVGGRTLTSWPSLRSDLRNAGANWVDREVVVDGKLVTSRKPDDIPAFNREMITLFREGRGDSEADRTIEQHATPRGNAWAG